MRCTGAGVSGPTTQLTWFDRTGSRHSWRGGTLQHRGPLARWSASGVQPQWPPGSFFARGGGLPYTDVWVHEFTRNTSTQLTFGGGVNWMAAWSPDGSRIVVASNRDGNFNLYQKDSSGAGKEDALLKTDERKFPYDWSRDGRFVLYSSLVAPSTPITVVLNWQAGLKK